MKFFAASIAALAVVPSVVLARAITRDETHTVHFFNNCGFGTPMLIQGPNVLSTGADYTSEGPLSAAIAYLQTGNCGFNGDDCTLVELTLTNGVSSADISLISPHEFSVTSGFGYYGACDGAGNDCTSAECGPDHAFYQPTDYTAQVQCSGSNQNLAITFCD